MIDSTTGNGPGTASAPAREGCFLFFTPEAGVVPHLLIQSLLARILKEKGQKVLFVRCHGFYPHCPVMDMYLVPHAETEERKKQICGECLGASHTVLDAYGLESIDLKDLVTPVMVERIRRAMSDLPRDLREFQWDGIPFGTLTVIDLVLATKVSDFAGLSEENRAVWIKYITTAMLSYFLTQEIIRQYPIAGIVHHEDYGILLAARLAGERHGIPSVHVGFTGHLGGDRRRVFLMHMPGSGDAQKMMVNWPAWRDLSLEPSRVPEPMDDLLGRFGSISSRVYSPKKTIGNLDLFESLAIPRGKKLLVAYTSSLDERLAVDSVIEALQLRIVGVEQPFRDQIEWLRAVGEFVGARDDYHLVVRVHPREGANKREQRVSQHLHQLKTAFGRPGRNCTFIWPDHDVSSYDLAEAADLVLISWSTLGLEVARLGVPVLASTYALAPRPNDDFNVWEPTPEAYFETLEKLVSRPPSLDSVLHAFRWHMLQYFGHTVDLSDIIPTRDFHGMARFFMPRESDTIADVFLRQHDMMDVNRGRIERSQEPGSLAAERKALRAQMRRALRFLFTGEELVEDYRLVLVRGGISPQAFLDRLGPPGVAPGTVIAFEVDGEMAFLEGRTIRAHYSPMGCRLALLGCDFSWGVTVPLPGEAMRLAGESALFAVAENRVADVDLSEVNRLKQEGRVGDALAAAARLAERGPVTPELLNLQGHLECMRGDTGAGKALFQRVVRDWPDFGKAHNNLSVLYWAEGDSSSALKHVTDGWAADPYNREIAANAIRINRSLGNRADAERIRAKYLKEKPQDADFILLAFAPDAP